MAEQYKKEISIRNVLGPSTRNIALLLSGDYVPLMAIVVVVGGPLAWFVNNMVMENSRIEYPSVHGSLRRASSER